MIINDTNEFEILDTFLENNTICRVGTVVIDDISYFEVISKNETKVLINKTIFNYDLFFKIMKRFIDSRNELLDENYKKVGNVNLDVEQGGASIEFKYNKCNATLFTSISDEETLAPTDYEFLMKLLNLIDNGCDPSIIIKDSSFYLLMGQALTIKFDRKLLKYVEEFAVNCKHNKKIIMKLERKNNNEK